MTNSAIESPETFDPLREAAKGRIKILDRADGGKEFVLPAMRNFREKVGLTSGLLIVTIIFVGVGFFAHTFITVTAGGIFGDVVGFILINHFGYFLLILGMFELLFVIGCLDVWLRSSRMVATRERLQSVTHWLCFKRTAVIATADIIEIAAANNTTIDTTRYYDLIVRVRGKGKGWLARNFPPKPEAVTAFTAADLEVFNTGGRKFAAATNIEGQREAEWLLGQLRAALGISL